MFSFIYSFTLSMEVEWNLYIKPTIGANKMWSLYTGGLYNQVQYYGKYIPEDLWKHCGLYKQVVLICRWSLERVWLYILIGNKPMHEAIKICHLIRMYHYVCILIDSSLKSQISSSIDEYDAVVYDFEDFSSIPAACGGRPRKPRPAKKKNKER